LSPSLSVVLLTWNEEANVVACLRSLARQTDGDFEAIVIDAASTDRTVSLVLEQQPDLPFPLGIVVADRKIPIGEARNRGVQLARAPIVAFLSADAEMAPTWIAEARRSLGRSDLAFGRQVHAPPRMTTAAAVRGLRYHFPPGFTGDPLRFASNVAAAYKREVLAQFPFDDWADAAEDLLLARRATSAGFRVAYNPRMVVLHRDVSKVRQEWRKNVREGYGCGLYVGELGVQWMVLAWGLLLLAALGTFAFGPWAGLLASAATLWLPAVRRGATGHHGLARGPALRAVLASPPFDLAFLVNYVRGLALRRRAKPAAPPSPTTASQETST
jgi:GT2 family glycosyltransferase